MMLVLLLLKYILRKYEINRLRYKANRNKTQGSINRRDAQIYFTFTKRREFVESDRGRAPAQLPGN